MHDSATEAIDARHSKRPASLASACTALPLNWEPLLVLLFGPAVPQYEGPFLGMVERETNRTHNSGVTPHTPLKNEHPPNKSQLGSTLCHRRLLRQLPAERRREMLESLGPVELEHRATWGHIPRGTQGKSKGTCPMISSFGLLGGTRPKKSQHEPRGNRITFGATRALQIRRKDWTNPGSTFDFPSACRSSRSTLLGQAKFPMPFKGTANLNRASVEFHLVLGISSCHMRFGQNSMFHLGETWGTR